MTIPTIPTVATIATLTRGGTPFTPAALFANDEQGAWFDPDPATCFTDTAGTTNAGAGDPVALMLGKSKGLVLGPELVTNGTFDSDTSGWVANSGATLSWDNGRAKVEADGNGVTSAYQAVSVTEGKTYEIRGDTEIVSLDNRSVNISIRDGLSAGNSSLLTVVNATSQGERVSGKAIYTAASDTIFIHARTTSDANVYTFDNISVRELPGNHAKKATVAARPILRQEPSGQFYLEDDQVDDALNATLPNLGTDATVAFMTETGVTIETGQTIGAGEFNILRGEKLYGIIIVDRALTARETTSVTNYLERLAP